MKMADVEKLKGPFETRAVLAAARHSRARGDDRTHTLSVADDVALCSVFPGSLADRAADDPNAQPTCRRCYDLDPRFGGNYGISDEFRARHTLSVRHNASQENG